MVPIESSVYYEPIAKFVARSGISRPVVYREIAKGNLRAIKLGKSTLIDVPAALAWMKTLPAADCKGAPR